MLNSFLNHSSPAQQVSEVGRRDQKEMEPKKNGKTEVPQSRRNNLNVVFMRQNLVRKVAPYVMRAMMLFTPAAFIAASCQKDCKYAGQTKEGYWLDEDNCEWVKNPEPQKHSVTINFGRVRQQNSGLTFNEYIHDLANQIRQKSALSDVDTIKVISDADWDLGLGLAYTTANRMSDTLKSAFNTAQNNGKVPIGENSEVNAEEMYQSTKDKFNSMKYIFNGHIKMIKLLH
jgi:hypothetical protein